MESNDTIKINKSDYVISTEGTVIKISVKGGAITLMDSKCTTPKIVQTDEDIFPVGVTADKKKTTLTVSNKFRGANIFLADYADTFTKIKATAISQNVSLVGIKAGDSIKAGKGDDTIYGNEVSDTIYGGAGNDSIDGGTGNDKLYGEDGNDTLTGGTGSDVFVYGSGEGRDIIIDYTAGQDKIKITSGSISKTSYSGKNVVFTIGSGSLTVQNGKGKKITIIDSAGKTSTQTYFKAASGRNALWFADDDNFITNDTRLDSITEVNYSVGNIYSTSNKLQYPEIFGIVVFTGSAYVLSLAR